MDRFVKKRRADRATVRWSAHRFHGRPGPRNEEQSQRLAAKLTAAGRPNALVVVPWASHAFDTINFNGPGSQISEFSIAWFLETVTR